MSARAAMLVALGLLVIAMALTALSRELQSPGEGDAKFMERCDAVGFSHEQCDFFRHGPGPD